jgi:hypothetical protein
LKGDAIRKLKEQNVAVTEEVEEMCFVFCGDTTTVCFDKSPMLLRYPIVIVECSFLFDEDKKKAAESKVCVFDETLILILIPTLYSLIH